MAGITCRYWLRDPSSCLYQDQCRFTHALIFSTFHCLDCRADCQTEINWRSHLNGKRHAISVRTAKAEAEAITQAAIARAAEEAKAKAKANEVFCEVCEKGFHQSSWAAHVAGAPHKQKSILAAQKNVMEAAESDKEGVKLIGRGDCGVVDWFKASVGFMILFKIHLTDGTTNVMIHNASVVNSQSLSPFVIAQLPPKNVGRNGAVLNLRFRHDINGRHRARLEIHLQNLTTQKHCIIVRQLQVVIGDEKDHRELAPVAPYKPPTKGDRVVVSQVVEGEAPLSLKAIPWKIKLQDYPIPPWIQQAITTGSPRKIIERVRNQLLPAVFSGATHGAHFKVLLWIEEIRMELELDRFDMHDTTLQPTAHMYRLRVPGLSEKRPSVLTGDGILVQPKGATDKGKWFEGKVHKVEQNDVLLRFHKSFVHSPAARYTVHFQLNRFPLRRQHQALGITAGDQLLFPLGPYLRGPLPVVPMQLYRNQLVGTNQRQQQAVLSILNLPAASPPFIVFGPPGTGKTVTIVEAIFQILRVNPHARILACAPSNSAADLITTRLSALGNKKLFRLYAPSRDRAAVPLALLPFTVHNGQCFSIPEVEVLKTFNVIVSTCVTASIPYGIGMARGYFTHIFVDEAGQASEPEVMIPIRTMADVKTKVILSGDPKQLGPVIHSNMAREFGLELSFLERLLGLDVYREDRQIRPVVKLANNYRSHHAILDFPNERFYSGDLVACGRPEVINSLLGSPVLPNKKFPVVFHAIAGQDQREASSPSFFNIHEVTQVKAYIKKLLADQTHRIAAKDITVITPYHGQCLKMRKALKDFAAEVNVGSVEEFQGQERRVIIISTVRSSPESIECDLKHTLGFVANPRRFNVAITRAQAMLIIVGDPAVLSLDPLWRSYLNYIYYNGGWTGGPISWDPDAPVKDAGGYDQEVKESAARQMQDFTERLERLTLAGVAHPDEIGLDDAVTGGWGDA